MNRRKRSIMWAAVPLATGLWGQNNNAPGRLKGLVVDEDGKKVPQARIIYARSPKMVTTKDAYGESHYSLPPGERLLRVSVKADANGAFDTGDAPAGGFHMCAGAPGYLDTCQWGPEVQRILASGETAGNVQIVLKAAPTITIRISDPLKLLPSKEDSLTTPSFIVGTISQKQFYSAGMPVKDSSHWVWQMAAPYGVPLYVWLHSRFYRLADSSGNALSSPGASIAYQVTTGAKTKEFDFTVLGRVTK